MNDLFDSKAQLLADVLIIRIISIKVHINIGKKKILIEIGTKDGYYFDN
jgi:hypothetical protein